MLQKYDITLSFTIGPITYIEYIFFLPSTYQQQPVLRRTSRFIV